MVVVSSVGSKRGQPFKLEDYPPATAQLIREKLLPVEEIIKALPRRFRFFSTFAMSQGRGFLRKLAIRNDYEDVRYFCAMTLEPYPILKNPNVKVVCAYYSPLDRFVAEKTGKTVAHLPRQFVQFCETIQEPGMIDFIVHAATPPDKDGYVNLGVNCEILHECLRSFARTKKVKIILELNSHVPWVTGHEQFESNKLHLSQVDHVYENHERLPQLPPIVATETEERIAKNVLPFIENGDTLQLGIGGVPNYIAEHLKDRRGLKIHSEMLTDGLVDLVHAGAIDNHGKEYMDGLMVGTFAAGTDKLYDFIDRNPDVVLLPIRAVNDPSVIARHRAMKSVNSALMMDLHGQAASDAIGFQQVSGIGGQLEFVMGAQRSPGGRSILCLKSTSKVHGKAVSNIVVCLPPGTPVTVPRHFADTIVTEWGTAEIRNKDAIERAQALVGIAHPAFREQLIAEARAVGLWERRPGFDTFARRAMFNNLGFLRKLTTAMDAKPPAARATILFDEVKKMVAAPDLVGRLRTFYEQNRS